MFDLLAKAIGLSAGFLYPIFASYKALKANNADELKKWMMYWIVVTCATTVEAYTAFAYSWFPLYQEVRAGFLVWLVLPQTQGSKRLYVEYIYPTLESHQEDVEKCALELYQQARVMGIDTLKKLMQYAEDLILGERVKSDAGNTVPKSESTPPLTYSQTMFVKFKEQLNKSGLSEIAQNGLQNALDSGTAAAKDLLDRQGVKVGDGPTIIHHDHDYEHVDVPKEGAIPSENYDKVIETWWNWLSRAFMFNSKV